ncbi:MAG: hypothetical protein AB7U73_20095 [Pirellulales bacterium]
MASAATFSFTPLGDLPGGTFLSQAGGVSADGSVAVGVSSWSLSGSGLQAFRWTSGGGMVGLGDLPGGVFSSTAADVSDDGDVVVGRGNSFQSFSEGAVNEAFRWTAGGGMVGLGDLSGGSFSSSALGVSPDGTVVVGQGTSASGIEAFRWTAGGGMVGLGDLSGGAFESTASAASADGSVVVGRGTSASGIEAFRWTTASGMVGLGDLPGGIFGSSAFDVSPDGSVVVGQSNSALGNEAFRWTAGAGMVGLGIFPGGVINSSVAHAVSADGAIIVGSSTSPSGSQAFLWTEIDGLQNLRDLLIAGGATGLTGWTLSTATDISPDGRTIVGTGTNPLGRTEAWIAIVPEPSSFVLAGCGALGALLLAARRSLRTCRCRRTA